MQLIASRLLEVLKELKRQYGMADAIDRMITFVAGTSASLSVITPHRTPADPRAALCVRAVQAVESLDRYRQTRKGYRQVLRDVVFLENVVKYGLQTYHLAENDITGFVLIPQPCSKTS